MSEIVKRIRAACDGHPAAQIPWPHLLLHEAADDIERLEAALKEIAELDDARSDEARGIARHALQTPSD